MPAERGSDREALEYIFYVGSRLSINKAFLKN